MRSLNFHVEIGDKTLKSHHVLTLKTSRKTTITVEDLRILFSSAHTWSDDLLEGLITGKEQVIFALKGQE